MELQTKFESKIYQIRIKLSNQYISFADITFFILKFKKGKNILLHLYNQKYVRYIELQIFIWEGPRILFNKWLVCLNNECVITD